MTKTSDTVKLDKTTYRLEYDSSISISFVYGHTLTKKNIYNEASISGDLFSFILSGILIWFSICATINYLIIIGMPLFLFAIWRIYRTITNLKENLKIREKIKNNKMILFPAKVTDIFELVEPYGEDDRTNCYVQFEYWDGIVYKAVKHHCTKAEFERHTNIVYLVFLVSESGIDANPQMIFAGNNFSVESGIWINY